MITCMTIECTDTPCLASVRDMHPAECTAAYRLLIVHDQVEQHQLCIVDTIFTASPVLTDTHEPAYACLSTITV